MKHDEGYWTEYEEKNGVTVNQVSDGAWTNADVSIPREEWGAFETGGSHISAGWTNADVSIPREEWGAFETGGPHINGKTPTELIQQGLISADTIQEEEREVVYQDIMLGFTNNKAMLSKKLDLVLSDPTTVKNVLLNQYRLAIKEMANEKRAGFVNTSPVDRKFQFVTTVNMLIAKGYDIGSLEFHVNNRFGREIDVDFFGLLSQFCINCHINDAKGIANPFWTADGRQTELDGVRKRFDGGYSPEAAIQSILKENHSKNPVPYNDSYRKYLSETALENPEPYEWFIKQNFGFFPVKEDVDNFNNTMGSLQTNLSEQIGHSQLDELEKMFDSEAIQGQSDNLESSILK